MAATGEERVIPNTLSKIRKQFKKLKLEDFWYYINKELEYLKCKNLVLEEKVAILEEWRNNNINDGK